MHVNFFTSSTDINLCPDNSNRLISSEFSLKSSFVPTNSFGTFSQKCVTSGSHYRYLVMISSLIFFPAPYCIYLLCLER